MAATHPWWPHLFSFPRALDPISWFWLSTRGYAFTSSGLQLSIPAGLILYWRKHNCHQRWCPLIQWKTTAAGDIVCRRHHPEKAKTGRQIKDHHNEALRSHVGN